MLFKVGLSNTETSPHFLNFQPVIDSIKSNEIGKVETNDGYFLGNVFEFYKQVNPEIGNFSNSVKINYDYETAGSGFEIE